MTEIYRWTRRTAIAAMAGCACVASAQQTAPPVPMAMSEAVDMQFVGPLLDAVAQPSGLRWDPKAVPFARALHLVERGEAIGFGISPTPERTARLQFSVPVFRGAVWAISLRHRQIAAQRPEDLAGLKVCTSRRADYGSVFPESVASGMQHLTGDLQRRLNALQAGRCDVLLVTSRNAEASTVRARIAAAGGAPDTFTVSKAPLTEQSVHFAVARDSPLAQHLPRIDDAIRKQQTVIRQLVRDTD